MHFKVECAKPDRIQYEAYVDNMFQRGTRREHAAAQGLTMILTDIRKGHTWRDDHCFPFNNLGNPLGTHMPTQYDQSREAVRQMKLNGVDIETMEASEVYQPTDAFIRLNMSTKNNTRSCDQAKALLYEILRPLARSAVIHSSSIRVNNDFHQC